jgi:hypothetical protein
LEEDAASVTAMTIVYIERTRTHEKNFLALVAKELWAAQDAAHELIGGAEAEAQGMLRLAGWVFEQKPAKMRLYGFSDSAGLSGNKTRDLGYIFFFDDSQLCGRSLLWSWPWHRRGRCHCAAAS